MTAELNVTGDAGTFTITDRMLTTGGWSPRVVADLLQMAANERPDLIFTVTEDLPARSRQITWEKR